MRLGSRQKLFSVDCRSNICFGHVYMCVNVYVYILNLLEFTESMVQESNYFVQNM